MQLNLDNPSFLDKTSVSDMLFEVNGIRIIQPVTPHIPLEEGIHLQISGEHDALDTPREKLQRFLIALGIAKTVAESGVTPLDAWANTRFEDNGEISVYGRTIHPDSWRRPVNKKEPLVVEAMPGVDTNGKNLQRLLGRYIPKWQMFASGISLFENSGDTTTPVGKDVYVEDQWTIRFWESIELEAILIKDRRHVKGIHVIVRPKKEFDTERQWQTEKDLNSPQPFIKRTLESAAVSLAIQDLLGGEGEIHNSGNWANGLKTTSENGGKLNVDLLSKYPRMEKRNHRPDIAGDNRFGTHSHFHIYIPDADAPVYLPSLSYDEAKSLNEAWELDHGGRSSLVYDAIIRLWEDIPPLDSTEEGKVQMNQSIHKLQNGSIDGWLKANVSGPLMSKPTV